jgi:hypothetical protein
MHANHLPFCVEVFLILVDQSKSDRISGFSLTHFIMTVIFTVIQTFFKLNGLFCLYYLLKTVTFTVYGKYFKPRAIVLWMI